MARIHRFGGFCLFFSAGHTTGDNASPQGSDDSFKRGVAQLEKWLDHAVRHESGSSLAVFSPKSTGALLTRSPSPAQAPVRREVTSGTGIAPSGASSGAQSHAIKRVIPTPSQARTLLRLLRVSPLTAQLPADKVRQLQELLMALLQGDTRAIRALSDKDYVNLDRMVALLLTKAPQNFRRPVAQQQQNQPLAMEMLMFERRHVMMVLRAINSMDMGSLRSIARQRMKTVKSVLYDVSRGRTMTLQKINQSSDPEDKHCCAIITNSLLRAHAEANNPQKPLNRTIRARNMQNPKKSGLLSHHQKLL